jgi:hypothetical protein
VPNTLPPAPQDLLAGVSGVYIVRDVAASGATVFAAVLPGGSVGGSTVIRCPSTGCAATPPTVGMIGADPRDGILAAFGDKVFWTRRTDNFSSDLNQLVRTNPDGSGSTTLIANDPVLYAGKFSHANAVFEDYALVYDFSQITTGGSQNGPNAGIHIATVDLSPPAVPNVRTPQFARSAVTGNESYFVYWADPISTPATPYDNKIHIYDLDGNHLAATADTFASMLRMQLSGNTLVFMGTPSASGSNTEMMACTLPACSDLHNVGDAVERRGFDFQLRNGRVYFASVEDQGCGMGLEGVLASCDLASLVGGTCIRQLHSTSFHYVNLDRIEVEDDAVYATSRTSTTSLFKAPL